MHIIIKKILKARLGKILFLQKTVYKKASYAQNGEDLIIRFLFNLLGKKNHLIWI